MDIQGIDDESNRGIIWFAQKGSSQSQKPRETLPCSEPVQSAKPVKASEATRQKRLETTKPVAFSSREKKEKY